jgi:hypothetical protein
MAEMSLTRCKETHPPPNLPLEGGGRKTKAKPNNIVLLIIAGRHVENTCNAERGAGNT